MPPRHSFWVILIGKTATSFRAKEREELVPTLRQLQRTQSDVSLRWFERGKVWESPEAAMGAAKLAETLAREKRTKEWRPGGEHRDPKARFELTRDQKRAKFKRDRERGDGSEPKPFAPRAPRPDRSERSPFERGPRPPRPDNRERSGDRPFGDRPPRREWRDQEGKRDRPFSPPIENPFKDRRRDEGRPDRRPDSRPDRRPEGRSDRRPDSRPDRRPEGRSDRRPEGRPDRRPPGGGPGRPPRPGDRGGFRPPKRRK